MAKKRTRAKALIAVLAAKFPKCFAVPDARRRPLKVGIDADVLAALGDTISRTELIRTLAMYCGSEGYLERVRAGAWCVCRKPRPFDLMKESRTVGHDGSAALLPFAAVGFAAQADQPARG